MSDKSHKAGRNRNKPYAKAYKDRQLDEVHKVARAARMVANGINAEQAKATMKRISQTAAGSVHAGVALYNKRAGANLNWKDYA